MRSTVRHILLIIVLFALVYPLLVWAVGCSSLPSNVNYIPNNYGHMDLRLAEADTSQPTLLFIGSSHAYRTFDTRIYDQLGFRTLNLGSSNQTPLQSLALLHRYLERWPQARVVMEVHPDVVGNDGVESAVDIVSCSRPERNATLMALSLHNIRAVNTLLCSFVDQMFNRSPVSRATREVTVPYPSRLIFSYIDGGFVEVSPLQCWEPVDLEPYTINPLPKQTKSLSDIVALLEQRHIPYLFVEVPATKARYSSYTNHEDWRRQILSLLPDSSLYINFNDDPLLMSQLNDTTCYFDDDHLNTKGIEIFNNHFINYHLSTIKSQP